jgi:hypothetical protein
MPNAIDNAIARLQNIAASLSTIPPTGTVIHAESDYPTEAAQPFPFSIAYLSAGRFRATNGTIHHNFPTIKVEIHFSRGNLKQAYEQINAAALEFPKRLVADPTLDGTIQTMVFGSENEIEYAARPFDYGTIKSQVLEFDIPLKLLQAPQSTST